MGAIDNDGQRFTNHSIQKTTVRKLQKAGVSNDKIASITGHKCEESLRYYAATDMGDHEKISLIFSKKPQPDTSLVPVERQALQPVNGASIMAPQDVFNNCTVYIWV